MTIARIEPVDCPVELPEADEVLPTARYVLESGNACAVTPAVKYLPDGTCRILINYAWEKQPTHAEESTVQEHMTTEFGLRALGPPEFLNTSQKAAASEGVANAWLQSGKKPPTN